VVGDIGMSFFAGLKAAYGTLETELTKTFDSSKDEEELNEDKGVTTEEKLEEVRVALLYRIS